VPGLRIKPRVAEADISSVESEFATRFRFGRPLTLAGGVAVLAFATARLWPESTDLPMFEAAIGVAVRSSRSPPGSSGRISAPGSRSFLPVGCDLLVALLRQAQGGSDSATRRS
jgi:hypothetical protein